MILVNFLCFKLKFWTYLQIVPLSKITIATPVHDLLLTLGLCVTADSREVWGLFLTSDSSCLVSMLNLVCVHIHEVRLPSSTGPTVCFMCVPEHSLFPVQHLHHINTPTSVHECVSHAFDCMCVYTQVSLWITPHTSSCVWVCACVCFSSCSKWIWHFCFPYSYL